MPQAALPRSVGRWAGTGAIPASWRSSGAAAGRRCAGGGGVPRLGFTGWIGGPPGGAGSFGLGGGRSLWQPGNPAPTVEGTTAGPMRVGGWVSYPDDGPDSDNVALWAAGPA